MKNWTDNYLTRCLEGVPQGKYRNRTEAELRDHLLVLSRDLEEAGHSAEEAQSLAQVRMGDPAELARHYVQEWRRRTLGQRSLIALELFLVGMCMVVMAGLYAINTDNFGKGWPALWSLVAIPTVGLLLWGFLTRSWTLARWSSWVIIMIQLPPLYYWNLCSGPFEMSGMMVSGWLGLLIHLLFFAWGVFNYYIATHVQKETSSSKAQSA